MANKICLEGGAEGGGKKEILSDKNLPVDPTYPDKSEMPTGDIDRKMDEYMPGDSGEPQ